MVHLSFPDIIIILIYFGLVLLIGFRSARSVASSRVDFLLAGRTLTLPVFVATLVSTWYGGILGVGEFSYKHGISNWVVFGLPYYIFALLFAFTIAKKVRATNLVTIPEKLYHTYDVKTSILGAALTFILVSPAPFILMLGILIQLVFGYSLIFSIIAGTVATLCYLYWGGFRSDVNTNIVEFFLMFIGFAVVLPFSYAKFGGIEFLRQNLPPLHLTWHGGNSLQYILIWFFIAMWTLVDPTFHQRCYAAKDGATAQKGIVISILFWLIFDFFTSTAGLYARAALPDLKQPVFAYPLLAELTLPSVAKGFFYVGMLATIMSSVSSFTFVGAATIGNDIVGRLLHLEAASVRDRAITLWTKIGLVVTAASAVLLAVAIPSVVRLWYVIATCAIPGLLVPLIAGYSEHLKIPSLYGFLCMVSGWLTSTLWLVSGYVRGGNLFAIEPMYPGLCVAVIVWGIGRAATRRSVTRRQ